MSNAKLPEFVLDRKAGKKAALYRQIEHLLELWIQNGTLEPKAKLPSTAQLMEHFACQRVTVRRAIESLVERSLLTSENRKGVYVCADLSLGVKKDAEFPHLGSPFRRLRMNRSIKIGVASTMIGEVIGPYHMTLINPLFESLRKCLGENDLEPVVMPLGKGQIKTDLLAVQRSRVDVMMYLGEIPPELLFPLIIQGPPSLLIDSQHAYFDLPSFRFNHRGGAYKALEHLIELGHKEIAVVTGPREYESTKEKWKGVEDAMAINGHLNLKVYEGDYWSSGAVRATHELMASMFDPSAIFYFNDEMALKGMQLLKEHYGLSSPKDMSVLGYDGIGSGKTSELSSIKLPFKDMVSGIVEHALALMGGEDPMVSSVVQRSYAGTLIKRSSTAFFRRR